MKDLKVLITGCGSEGAHGVLKSLRANQERTITVIGLDTDPQIATRYLLDKYFTPPRRYDPAYIPYVLELAARESVDIVYPIPTEELELFASVNDTFERQGQRLVVSSSTALSIANNKARLYQYIKEAGLACAPRYRIVSSWVEFVAAVQDFGYPQERVCFKPSKGTGSKGFRILDSKINRLDLLLHGSPTTTFMRLEELAPILEPADIFPEIVVMEYLPGDEYDIDVLAHEGKTLSVIPRKNERMWYGMSLICTAISYPELINYSHTIVSALGLSYVVNISFKMDRQNAPKLIEINPRIPGSIISATMSGVNMPYLAVKLALGEPVSIPPVRWGTKMIRYWDELFITSAMDSVLQK